MKISQPPLGVLSNDPDAKWTTWDYKLVKALEIYDNMMAGGAHPMYIDRSDRVRFEVKSYVSKSKAVLDRAEEKASSSKSKNYGKILYTVPETIDGGPLPTLEEFLEEQADKRSREAGNFRVSDKAQFGNAGWKPRNKGVEL